MSKWRTTDSVWFIAICVIVIGTGVGWLIGLSVSPVVSTVLTSVTGSVAAIVAALGGLDINSSETDEAGAKKRVKKRINPLPLAALVFGIVVGSILGLLARNTHIFGSDIAAEVTKWTDLDIPKEQIVLRLLDTYYPQVDFITPYSQTLNAEIDKWVALDIPKRDVAQRLFDRQYPEKVVTNTAPSNTSHQLGSILYAIPADECTNLLAAVARATALNDEQQIVVALISSPHIGLQRLPDIVSNTATLRQLVEEVLCVTQ